MSKENRIDSDSFLYNRNTGIGRAFGNISLTDTVQKILIKGKKGIHNRFEKTTLISGNAIAIKKLEEDSLFIKADLLFIQKAHVLHSRKHNMTIRRLPSS